MFKAHCLIAVVILLAACTKSSSDTTTTSDSTQVATVAEDSITAIVTEEHGVEETLEETPTEGDTTPLEKMYADKSEQIKANAENLYEATLSVNGYESSTSVLFYFSKSGSLLYASEGWDMEGRSGSDEYFADADDLIFSMSESSYDDEGGTVTQTTLWSETLGGTIFTKSPDESVTTKATDGDYGNSRKNEFSAKANAIYEILKTGEINDNGSTIEARIVEEVNYGETFEEVTTLTMPKALYTLLTKN